MGTLLRVGLTGGIGAGKSEVSQRLAAYGAVLIDADAIAREVVAPGTPGLAAVIEVFGAGVLHEDGSLDRERLGEIVFADAKKLARLNAIVHPLVGRRMGELEAAAAASESEVPESEPGASSGPGKAGAGADAIVVHDVPLIAENDLRAGYDLVVVVDAPESVQISRLTRLRDMSAEQAQARMAAQAARADRLAIADIVLDNSGSLSELDRQVGDLWSELRRRARIRNR